MKRIVSGLTSTGKLTLGNYIGSIRNLNIARSKGYEVLVFIADLHAITTSIEPNELRSNVIENIKLYIACGLNPREVKLFVQSQIKGHTDLFWILATNSNQGELARMTQFKDKVVKQKNKTEVIPNGLFLYPLLMAADIMIYNPDIVIVGKDQKQHLELTKKLIKRINKKYNLNFKDPAVEIKGTGSKIMALQNPEKKMSKSDENENNTIFLLDSPKKVKNKIKTAVTDSENKVYYDLVKKPGISNLLTIYSSLKNLSIKQTEELFVNTNYKYFKKEVASLINEKLAGIQKVYNALSKKQVIASLDFKRDEIQKIADDNLEKIKKAIGL